jgi:Sec-independent protein secretion pathway component TatC
MMAVPLCIMFFASIGVAYLVGKDQVAAQERLDRELAEFQDDEE